MSDDRLRRSFNEDAELYARARPSYPSELFADLAGLAAIGRGARVLEIGPGTGQATRALVASGARVVVVELGAELAGVLARDPALAAVETVVSAFEDWPLPEEPFDSVVAFTSWHWIDPAVRSTKAAAALRPNGVLATVTTSHVLGGTVAFFRDAQECYERWDPSTPSGLRLTGANGIPLALDEVDSSTQFSPAVRRRHERDISYSTEEYLDVLSTYSGHRALDPAARRGLLACIADLIEGTYGGSITKRYLYELRVARKRSAQ